MAQRDLGGGGGSVADRSQENPQESLTVQELTREIVREALEAQAAEKAQQRFIEGGREHWKAQVAFFSQMITVSGAALLATTALIAALRPPDPQIGSLFTATLIFTAINFLVSALVALISLFAASARLTEFSWGEVPAREEADKRLTSDFVLPRFFTYFSFGMGLSALLMTVLVVGLLPVFSGS
jgi:hypothetical protein